jgi:hypothetical protein
MSDVGCMRGLWIISSKCLSQNQIVSFQLSSSQCKDFQDSSGT